MRTNRIYTCKSAMSVAALCLLQAFAGSALGQSAVQFHGNGSVIQQSGGLYALNLDGEASHLGLCTCRGELDLVPGATEGEKSGEGIAAFTAANGDVIVGVVTCHISPEDGIQLGFHWRDSVKFSDGTVACSTGRFEESRPPGMIIRCVYVCFFYDGLVYCRVSCSTYPEPGH